MNFRSSFLAALLLLLASGSAPAQPPVITHYQHPGNGTFVVWFNGEPGATFRIVAASDLTTWDTLAYQIADASFGDFGFTDPTTAFFTHRFYGAANAVGDVTFPTLNVTSPLPNESVGSPTVLLQGTASDANGIREIRVNDLPIAGTTNFSATLPLTPGTNRFLLSAIDLSANRNRRSQFISVHYVPAVPAFFTQPSSQINDVGTTAHFGAVATGSAPLSYQWRKDGVNVSDGPRISGAATPALAISNVGAADVAGYSLVVTNTSGAATSEVAILTVQAPPGFIAVFGANFAENFDSMGSTGTNTPPGWFTGTGTGAIFGTNVVASTGSSSGGGNYNLGSTTNSDRALGSLAASATQRDTEARFINASGSNIVAFNISYTGEQWRQGGAAATNNDLTLQYSITGTGFTALGTAFDFSSPFDAGTAGALDGNNATNRVAGIGGDYVPASAITNGGVFHLRWADADNASSDHALAIDDLTITFTFDAP